MTTFDYDPLLFFKSLSTHGIGFDSVLAQFKDTQDLIDKTIKSIPNYPPFNITKMDDDHYVLEMAVAGFGKNSLDIEMANGVLSVTGKMESDSNKINDSVAQQVLYKGIASRAFTRKFALADTIEIKNAELVNGMLKIYLENLIPENKKARKIEISDFFAPWTNQILDATKSKKEKVA